MSCYKCGTDKDLSIKNRRRNGSILYICRACRRKQWREAHSKPIRDSFGIYKPWGEDWELRAHQSYQRVLSKRCGVILKDYDHRQSRSNNNLLLADDLNAGRDLAEEET